MENNLNNENDNLQSNFTVVKTKKKMDKRTKITFIIMSVLLAFSLTTTIVLAAFQAQKTSTATLTFASGIKMKLDPKTSGAAIKITSADYAVTGTFSYSGTMTNLNSNVSLDGITATVDQAGYVAYSVILKEGSSQIAGSWSNLSSNASTFVPSSGSKNWKAVLTVPSGWTISSKSNSTIKMQNATAFTAGTGKDLFTSLEFAGSGTAANITDLAGRTIVMDFKIVADTASIAGAVASV